MVVAHRQVVQEALAEYVGPSVPTAHGGTVVRLEDYRPDADLVGRVEELLAGRSNEVAWSVTGIHPNQMRDIRKGKVAQPTFNMLVRLARLQDWASPTWVATGQYEWQRDEAAIDSLAALHAWDLKQARKRMAFFERILCQQLELVATPPEVARQVAEIAALEDTGAVPRPPAAHADTAPPAQPASPPRQAPPGRTSSESA